MKSVLISSYLDDVFEPQEVTWTVEADSDESSQPSPTEVQCPQPNFLIEGSWH